jgi:hypothetical protein
MRVRKASIAGVGVDPNALTPSILLSTTARTSARATFEVTFSLGDLRSSFFRQYLDWLADLREYPDPDDELASQLRALAWPSLGVLAEVDPHLFAVVLLALGDELLRDLEWGRDPMVPVRWILTSIDEVELTGRRITARGVAVELPAHGSASN